MLAESLIYTDLNCDHRVTWLFIRLCDTPRMRYHAVFETHPP